MTVSKKTKSYSIAELEAIKRQNAGKITNGRSASTRIDMAVLELFNRTSEPLTVNEVHASLYKIGVHVNSQTIRVSMNSLVDLGLLARRPQTDAERMMLGMTIGIRPHLYSAGKTVPARTENMAIPGIRVEPLPDTKSAQTRYRRKKAKKRAQARQAKNLQTGTVRPAKGNTPQTAASKPTVIERHENAITEMQERISSLEGQLRVLQQLLR